MTRAPIIITAVLASSGLCMALCALAYRKMPERRIREEKQRTLEGPAFLARCAGNAAFTVAVVYAYAFLLDERLFYEHDTPLWRGAAEAVGILAVYDVLYYLMHRFPFHQWSVLKRVHAVHHRARSPIALDSLFLHPVEGLLGLTLLVLCTWIVGPVHVYAFGVCFFVYSWLNIIIHAGVALPVPYFGMLARKHHTHHASMKGGNYASITPLPDILFGTAE